MSQTKLQSFKETCTQTALGYTVAISSQLLIFPVFDINISLLDNLLIGVWFTIISIVRGYVVRRVFNKKQGTEIKDILEETIKLNSELLLSNRKKDIILKKYESGEFFNIEER